MKSVVLFVLFFLCACGIVKAIETQINLNFDGLIPPLDGNHDDPVSDDDDGGDVEEELPEWDLDCSFITHEQLESALSQAACGDSDGCPQVFNPEESINNGGLNFNMWGTVVNRAGRVCAVAFSGPENTDQWIGSRVISAQKANTANLFSLPHFALSSANLYQPTQPSGSLYGLQESNPVDASIAYAGASAYYGNPCDAEYPDPMCGQKPGGINVFGGGLALYDSDGTLLGGVGVSGDTSCADHNIAWKVRHALGYDHVPAGVAGAQGDNIIYPASSAFGHPQCSEKSAAVAAAFTLPTNTKK